MGNIAAALPRGRLADAALPFPETEHRTGGVILKAAHRVACSRRVVGTAVSVPRLAHAGASACGANEGTGGSVVRPVAIGVARLRLSARTLQASRRAVAAAAPIEANTSTRSSALPLPIVVAGLRNVAVASSVPGNAYTHARTGLADEGASGSARPVTGRAARLRREVGALLRARRAHARALASRADVRTVGGIGPLSLRAAELLSLSVASGVARNADTYTCVVAADEWTRGTGPPSGGATGLKHIRDALRVSRDALASANSGRGVAYERTIRTAIPLAVHTRLRCLHGALFAVRWA